MSATGRDRVADVADVAVEIGADTKLVLVSTAMTASTDMTLGLKVVRLIIGVDPVDAVRPSGLVTLQ